MGNLTPQASLVFDFFVFMDFPWKLALVILSVYCFKVFIKRVFICLHWFTEYIIKYNSKYDLLLLQLENLNSKLDTLQKTNEGQVGVLEELKMMSNNLRSDLDVLRVRLASLQASNSSASAALSVSGPGGPPPPPPPPPPFSLVTPALKIAPPSSVKTDQPKKKPTGPPQFSISQADITKVLQKLRKTSSTARLLGSGSNQPRKTPPRRKLFGRTPGHSRKRSITALSPGDLTRQKTPLSSISPPMLMIWQCYRHSRKRSITALSPGDLTRQKTPLSSISPPHGEADVNGNGCDFQT